MTYFNIGDRVVVKNHNLQGQKGSVIHTYHGDKSKVVVRMDSSGFVVVFYNHELEITDKMIKFKVGDKVEVSNPFSINRDVGYITNIKTQPNLIFEVETRYGLAWYAEQELEKVEEDVTQEYEVGKPYLWFGGECPVPPRTKVKIRFGKADLSEINKHWHREVFAGEAIWHHEFSVMNIVMFEVVEYPKQTRKVELELTEEEINTIKNVLGKANL